MTGQASATTYGQWAGNVAPHVTALKRLAGLTPTTYPGHHPDQGHAADYMINGDVAAGQRLAEWAAYFHQNYNVWYVQYRQKIWNRQRAAEGWRLQADRGSPTANHYDHVHISFNP